MSEAKNLFPLLQQSAEPGIVGAIEKLVRDAPDRDLCRVNVLDFAAKRGLDQERSIAAFLHAARLGLFELSWNVLCPSCGGVLDAGATLRSVNREEYHCAWCAAGYEPILDEIVEVTFTVNRRVRRIAAHDPNELPFAEYFRQVFWSSAIDLPENLDQVIEEVTLDTVELPPGEKALLSLQLPAKLVMLLDPVTHMTQFLAVKGEPTRERQSLSLFFDKVAPATDTIELSPGPLRLSLENRTDTRVLPGLWVATDRLNELLSRRKPFLSAKRLLTNQVFRDLYGADTIDVDQRLKITSLTFLFTDLRGSTELYERVGDLVAFDLVRAHFRLLNDIICRRSRGCGQDQRRCGDGDLFDTRSGGRRGVAHAGCDERLQRRGPRRWAAAQDRHPRGTLPRRRSRQPPGLFRPHRQYRGARAGSGRLAFDPGDRVGRQTSRILQAARNQRA